MIRLLGKPGSERVAMIAIYQWATVLAISFLTNWLDELGKSTGFWGAFGLLAIIIAVLTDNMLPNNYGRSR